MAYPSGGPATGSLLGPPSAPVPWGGPWGGPWAANPPPIVSPRPADLAVAFARAQQGKPYCWGGTGPACFDCSGLVHSAWRSAGKKVPRSSADMRAELATIPPEQALAGDIAWRPGHVGLYVGGGWVIHSPSTGKVVTYEPVGRYETLLRP